MPARARPDPSRPRGPDGRLPGRVSQILGGGENLTLRTLAALSTALDARFDVELNALKAGDAYTSHSAASAEAVPQRHAA